RRVNELGRGTPRRQEIIVGSGPLAVQMVRELETDPRGDSVIVGFIDDEPCEALARTGIPYLGRVGDLEHILMHRVVDDVLIGLPIKSRFTEIQQVLDACARVGVPAHYPADLFRPRVGVALPSGEVVTPVLSLKVAPFDYRLGLKRILDAVLAALLLMLTAPLMLAIAIAVKVTSPGPVFFGQERYGYMKRRFRM